MNPVVHGVLVAANLLVLGYFVALNLFYLLTTLVAWRSLRRYVRRLKSVHVEELLAKAGAPPITLIAPAYNEEATCVEATRSLLTLRYPTYEVLIVNDGSKDATVARLVEAFDLVPAERLPTAQLPTAEVRAVYRSTRHRNLWLVDKANGGKSDALNAGLNHCRTPIFCAMDADTLLEPDALIRVVRPFLEDRHTVAAGGIIRIVNGCSVHHGQVTRVRMPSNFLARIQVLEYLRAFHAGRMGWGALDAMLIISGAFGLFRRDMVVAAGGYATDTVGEDMELVVRLHRHCRERDIPYSVTFVPDPVAWTECPESLRVLGRQRDRWQRGLAQTLTRHRAMLLRRRYGRIGMLAFPYFFFLEMLGPLVEVIGYTAFVLAAVLGLVAPLYAVAFLLLAVLFGMGVSIAAVALEETTFRRYTRSRDLGLLFLMAFVESFGYRQLSTWWRFRGLTSAWQRSKGWGAMQRKGFAAQAPPAA